ncbi:MAG: (E)-4-hydroxy-3-methylbut-2-enyl-diphosphate synthase [Elusimicrobia bacterium]|jgi:(E)-4-hydroxy-3-methylbut-2-enyl-diphosphate synthase|nr:(E)-4-hydroxy-3-methylbut-2-enyl-diphosphate synthase [Elusimicrobiota bacterium]
MPSVPTDRQNLTYSPDLFAYRRRKTRVVMVGDVGVGGENPLRLQSMTTTRTQDTEETVAQAIRLIQTGCEIVRMTAPTEVDAKNLKNIATALRSKGFRTPLVADIHFRPEAAMEAAEHVEKVRINPGNFSDSKAFKIREYSDAQYKEEIARIEERFTPLVVKLKRLGRALRIGTNHGSLSDRILNRFGDSPEGMVESALEFVRICRTNNFHDIILSMKASNPKVMIAAYRLLAARMDSENMDYPFHLGVTEAGDGEDGRIKSAVGIGSLLEDGIGDTLRVSLTEEPETELPVARRLATPYNNRPPTTYLSTPPPDGLSHVENPFHYTRRTAREVRVGPIALGATHPPRAVTRLDPTQANATALMAILEQRLKSGQGVPPEIIEWPVRTMEDISLLDKFRGLLRFETSRLAFLVRLENGVGLKEALPLADGIALPPNTLNRTAELAPLVARAGKPLWLFSRDVDPLLNATRSAMSHGLDLVLALEDTHVSRLLHHARFLVAQPWVREAGFPLHIVAPADPDEEAFLLSASTLAGGLLADGIGDSLSLTTDLGLDRNLELLANILQGAGARVTKAEFVSCPSCGRTLFDLQSTTDRIKKRTAHLLNVKIAIMGCIVNGPGEMADADFGYVGGGPGKINLYVGKDCVEKGLPAKAADERLVSLIKEHGKWRDPQ